jgi:hypothetical protein
MVAHGLEGVKDASGRVIPFSGNPTYRPLKYHIALAERLRLAEESTTAMKRARYDAQQKNDRYRPKHKLRRLSQWPERAGDH